VMIGGNRWRQSRLDRMVLTLMTGGIGFVFTRQGSRAAAEGVADRTDSRTAELVTVVTTMARLISDGGRRADSSPSSAC
jgi:hypothetical protein